MDSHERGDDTAVERCGLDEAAEGGDGDVGLVVVEAQLGERLGDPCYAAFPGGGLVLEVDPAEARPVFV